MTNPHVITVTPQLQPDLSINKADNGIMLTNINRSVANSDADVSFPYATYYQWSDGTLEYRSGLWSDPVHAQDMADAANERMGATAVVVVDERTMQIVEPGAYHYAPAEAEAVAA